MVHSGQRVVPGAERAPTRGRPEIRTATLRQLCADPRHARPVLLTRNILILVTVGHGALEIDFRPYRCRPGSLTWARPGQVIRYGPPGGLDAIVIDWPAETLAGLVGQPVPTVNPLTGHWQLAGEDEDAVINEVSQLVVDCRRQGCEPGIGDLLRHQLAVLLLRITLLSTGDPPGAGDLSVTTFRRLCQEIEDSYPQTRRVEEYARRLGCSVRTLTRACLAATGRSAKQLIDDRVALQAMRLLAATDAPIAEIGHGLGFPEPTNFGRFFAREVGQSPGAFRAVQAGPA